MGDLRKELEEIGLTEEEYYTYKLELGKSLKGYVKYIGRRIIMLCMIFLPITILLYIIGAHSNVLINNSIYTFIRIILTILVITFIFGVFLYVKNIKIDITNIINIKLTRMYIICMSIYVTSILTLLVIFYGPIHEFKNLIIKGSMITEKHQYARWIYSEEEINSVLNRNDEDK